MTVAFLMLYGNGWTQRWRIASAGACWQWTDGRPEGVQLAVSGDWFPSEKAAREAARQARRRACVAVGP